jgi:hypothetical protein
MTGDLVLMVCLLSMLALAVQSAEPQLGDDSASDAVDGTNDPVTVAALCGVHL